MPFKASCESNMPVYLFLISVPPSIKVRRNKTMKMKKSTLAIPADAAAIPVNPNMAAIIATTKNIRDHLSMTF